MKGELELKESEPPSSYTYGELTMGSFKKILKAFVDAAPVGDQITINYVDIGSGSGKTVLHAAVKYKVWRCHGFEILKNRVNLSYKLLEICIKDGAPSDLKDRVSFC